MPKTAFIQPGRSGRASQRQACPSQVYSRSGGQEREAIPSRATSVCKSNRHQGTKHSDPMAGEAHAAQELGLDSLDKKELKVISSMF